METMTTGARTLDAAAREVDDGYPALEALIRVRVGEAKGPLFTTDAEGLYDLFLANLPGESRYGDCTCGADRSGPSAEAHDDGCPATKLEHSGPRKHYDCRCCRAFVEKYGGLVTMGTEMAGETTPLLWWPWMGLPETFKNAGIALVKMVSKARVTGVFYSSETTWGTPSNVPLPPSKYAGQRWTHLSGPNPSVFKTAGKTAEQRMAELKEDRGVLSRGLAEYDRPTVVEALRVLKADALTRSEKAVPIAEWFLDLRTRLEGVRNKTQRENIVWLAVATAPPGFAHVKNTVIGTLLDDIKAGLGFEAVKARWTKKMHPLQYQRPQVLKDGQIEAAEKLVEKLGVAKSLDRRYARLAEVLASAYLWRPIEETVKEKAAGSVFGHLKPKAGKPDVKPLALPAVTMTWAKFARDVLPTALKMELDPPPRGTYFGLVTAVNPDDPPVLQWDGLEWIGDPDHNTWPRNPVSWYFYRGGSTAWHWGLKPDYVEVTAVLRKPPHWQRPDLFAKESEAAFLVLKGCREQTEHRGGGLFPEILKTDLREARAAIEARTKDAVVAGHEESDANGYALESGAGRFDVRLRVTAADGTREYTIDRWE